MSTALIALWTKGECLGSSFLGSIIANVVSSLGYDIGKTALARLLPETLNGDADDAREINDIALDALGAAITLIAAIESGSGDKTSKLTKALARWRHDISYTTQQDELGDGSFQKALKRVAKIRDLRTAFDIKGIMTPQAMEEILGISTDETFAAELNRRLLKLLSAELGTDSPIAIPDTFRHNLRDGFVVSNQPLRRLTLFAMWVLFFDDYVSRNPFALNKLALQAIRLLGQNLPDEQSISEAIRHELQTHIPDHAYFQVQFAGIRNQLDKINDVLTDAVGHIQSPITPRPQARPQSQHFTGRAKERSKATFYFANEGVRLILHGVGGAGKTSLARQIALDLAERYPDGTIEIAMRGSTASPITETEVQLQSLRQLVGYNQKIPPNPAALSSLYNNLLGSRKVLLLIDDARSSTVLEEIVPPRSCGMIVTSRSRLMLDSSKSIEVGKLPLEDAIVLVERLIPNAEKATAKGLSRACDGLPEAIGIVCKAIAKSSSISPEVHLERFRRNRLSWLTPVKQAYNYSLSLLPPADRESWAALGVFQTIFMAPAANRVIGDQSQEDTDLLLERFRDVSMIHYNDETKHFEFHDLAREYAFSLLDEGGMHAAKTRHATFILDLISSLSRKAEESVTGFEMSAFFIGLNGPDIVAAQSFVSKNAKRDDACLQMTAAFGTQGRELFLVRVNREVLVKWLEESLNAFRALGNNDGILNVTVTLSSTLCVIGRINEAISMLEAALGSDLVNSSLVTQVSLVGNLANAYSDSRQMKKAVKMYVRQIRLAETLGDSQRKATAAGNLGNALYRMDKLRSAKRFLYYRLELAEHDSDLSRLCRAVGRAVVVSLELGEHSAVRPMIRRFRALSRSLGDAEQLGARYSMDAMLSTKRPGRQAKFLDATISLYASAGCLSLLPNSLLSRSAIAGQLGDNRGAMVFALRAIAVSERIQRPDLVKKGLRFMIEYCQIAGNHVEAARFAARLKSLMDAT